MSFGYFLQHKRTSEMFFASLRGWLPPCVAPGDHLGPDGGGGPVRRGCCIRRDPRGAQQPARTQLMRPCEYVSCATLAPRQQSATPIAVALKIRFSEWICDSYCYPITHQSWQVQEEKRILGRQKVAANVKS